MIFMHWGRHTNYKDVGAVEFALAVSNGQVFGCPECFRILICKEIRLASLELSDLDVINVESNHWVAAPTCENGKREADISEPDYRNDRSACSFGLTSGLSRSVRFLHAR